MSSTLKPSLDRKRFRGDLSKPFGDYSKRLLDRSHDEGDCRIWDGSKTRIGYGQMSYMGKTNSVHRVAWMVSRGEIPDGAEVDHTCWNRDCINVAHLRLTTHRQNGRNLSGAYSRSKTGVRNVSLKRGKYQVTVGKDHIGTYATLDEAARVAERERVIRYGEYAGRG